MAKIPIILEPGRADGKLVSSDAIFDENKGMFQSEINDIQDTLNSDNPNKPLSAKQGKVLKELLNSKVIEVGAVPIDTEPTEGNTTHIVNSDGLAKEFNKCNTTIINTDRIANEAIIHSKLSVDIQNLITNLNKTATFAGIATPTTNPGTPNGLVFYIATTAGNYSNFGNIEISKGESAILKWNNGIWTKNSFKPITDFNSVFDANGRSLTELENELIKSPLSPYFVNFDLSRASNIVYLYYLKKIEDIDKFIDIEIRQYPAPLEQYYFQNTFSSSYAIIEVRNSKGESIIQLTPQTATAPFSISSFEDKFEYFTKKVFYNNHIVTIYGKVNWYQLYLNKHINFAKGHNILYKKVFIEGENLQFYPFVSGTTMLREVFSPIKDIYIPNRDDSKYYFLWTYYPSGTDYYQFEIGCYDKSITSPVSSDVTIVASFSIKRSTVTDDMKKSYQLVTNSGCKLLVDLSEADKVNVNYWHKFYYGTPNIFQFDWHKIDKYSPILIDERFDSKQDKLVSGTNIKTINGQAIIGSGDITIECSNSYIGLSDKPSINNVPLLGNKSLSDLSIQPKLISGNNIKTINNQSILGNGNIEIECGATDYDNLINKPTFKTINGQSVLGSGNIQSAESITNSPDNITIEEVNSVLRLKDLSNSSFKYGYKHIYDDITITHSSNVASWANSIVEIKGTITLTGSYNIDLPNNCILYFNGGSIKGDNFTGKLYPYSAKIIAPPYQIFYGNTKISIAYGNDLFYADTAYGEWFGAKGDGITPDGWAFTKLTSAVYCNKIQLLKKTYILERNINIKSCTLSGYGSTLKRYSKFADVLITEPTVVTSSGTHTLTVDTNDDTYSNLEVGMAVFIMNNPSNSRQVVSGRWIISEINGESITIVGNSMDAVYDANTMCLVTGFNLVNLNGRNSRVEGVILDGGLNLTSPIYPLDRTPWEADCTIGGGYAVENASIEDCYIINSLADAIMVGGKNNIFSHNTILHSGANGIHLSGNYTVHIDNNYIFDSNLNPLTLHNEGAITYSNNIFEVTITNNIFDNCLTGIGSIDSADDCKSIIIGNIFRNFRTHGIQGTATSTSYGSITRQFIINNNRFIATQDDAASWESSYLYSPNIPRQEATGYGIYFNAHDNAYWKNIVINSNDFIDCGVYIKNSNSVMLNNNSINIGHNFTSTPNNIILILTSIGVAHNNFIISNSKSKTNCFLLTGSKVSVKGNGYKLTNCTLTDTTYNLVTDNIDLT